MRVVMFEDATVEQLEPVTLGRPAYAISCGGDRLVDWVLRLTSDVTALVRPYLQPWQAAEYPLWSAFGRGNPTTLYVNARLVPSRRTFECLRRLQFAAHPGLLLEHDTLAAAVLPPEILPPVAPYTSGALAAFLSQPQLQALPRWSDPVSLLTWPHEIVRHHLATLADNLAYRIGTGDFREVRDGVFVAPGTQLGELVFTDCSQGPIVIDEQAVVRPFSCLSGPVYLGPHSRVNEHASIKHAVTIGPRAKVGGEVEATIVEAWSNKQHHGYLGHSYLGSWVNLGAGTSNSNLKNTYGMIRMEVQGQVVDTGMQFLGCIVGDYTKSAINTSIYTGKLIGACSMLYGTVTTNVPSFANYARSIGQLTEISSLVAARTQQRVHERRGIAQQPWHDQLFRDMYERAVAGRQLVDRPVAL